jgi:aldehyde dehydrogenase (NAD+)
MLGRSLLVLSLTASIGMLSTAAYVSAASAVESHDTVPKQGGDNNQMKNSATNAKLISSLPLNKFYINGTWVDSIADTPVFFDLVDPSTAKVVANVALASSEDVDAAVLAAKEAWPRWNYDTSPKERQRLVKKLIDVYSTRFEDMAQLVSTEMGSPIAAARSSHVGGGRGNIRSALHMMYHFDFERPLPNIDLEDEDEQLTTILYEAVGVVGMITPWNWPLNQITLVSVGCFSKLV